MNQKEAKEKIQALINKLNVVKSQNKLHNYNEAMTKKDFILPLFHSLGWNIEDSSEVSAKETISKKRVDYSFKIQGIPKFFLEAKALKEDLKNIDFMKQAINYAWLKGCTWAVLTNFEEILILNAEWKTKDLKQNLLKTISYTDFLNRWDELWLLSKESVTEGLLDKEAEKWGRRTKKIAIDKKLLEDFTKFRALLSRNIAQRNIDQNLSENDIDESVQRILDRLIFIRNCEDRELEEKKLLSSLREYENNNTSLLKSIKNVFSYYDQYYNSKIFSNHLCDDLFIDDDVLKKIIYGLYFTDEQFFSYDFSLIEADVLGSIYEQYLGHILKKTERRTTLKENHTHRKEQGIYYTPTYIVDFIVRNTLGELLKEKNINPETIRVLDPACGSGSFLIKAFDILNEFYLKHDTYYLQSQMDFETGLPYTTKVKILKNHLFGVDLDKQAVEIAQLNLLLKIAEKGQRLPLLQDNIKCGNSLIDDPAIACDKAFRWEDEFQDIIKEGGFDVIIGNPPWVSLKGKHKSIDVSEEELKYLFKKYPCDHYRPNLFEMFLWRSLDFLKDGGYFGFIVPDRLCYNQQFIPLRKYILEHFSIKKLYFKTVFEGVISDNVIFILKKEKTKNHFVKVAEYPSIDFKKILQKVYHERSDYSWFFVDDALLNLFEKIKQNPNGFPLKKKFKTSVGFIAKQNKITFYQENPNQIKVLKGENVVRFGILGNYYFEFQKDNLAGGTQDIKKLNKKNKVLLRKTGIDLIATFDNTGIYPEQSLYFIYTDDDVSEDNLKILCALLNSKLLNCYYKNFAVTNRDATPQLKKIDLDQFPIILPQKKEPLLQLVDSMLALNRQLIETGEKTIDKRSQIEKEIKKIQNKMDELIYNVYGLTEREKMIIEESLKYR